MKYHPCWVRWRWQLMFISVSQKPHRTLSRVCIRNIKNPHLSVLRALKGEKNNNETKQSGVGRSTIHQQGDFLPLSSKGTSNKSSVLEALLLWVCIRQKRLEVVSPQRLRVSVGGKGRGAFGEEGSGLNGSWNHDPIAIVMQMSRGRRGGGGGEEGLGGGGRDNEGREAWDRVLISFSLFRELGMGGWGGVVSWRCNI